MREHARVGETRENGFLLSARWSVLRFSPFCNYSVIILYCDDRANEKLHMEDEIGVTKILSQFSCLEIEILIFFYFI